MKRFLILAALALAGCSQPPQSNVDACPPLPRPLGETIAAQRAFILHVITLYSQCAASVRQN